MYQLLSSVIVLRFVNVKFEINVDFDDSAVGIHLSVFGHICVFGRL